MMAIKILQLSLFLYMLYAELIFDVNRFLQHEKKNFSSYEKILNMENGINAVS